MFDIPELIQGLAKFSEIVAKRLYLFEEQMGIDKSDEQPQQFFTPLIQTVHFWLNISIKKLNKISTTNCHGSNFIQSVDTRTF